MMIAPQASSSTDDDDVLSASISSELDKLVARVADLQHSVDSWTRWYVIALALVALAAVAVGITNTYVLKRQRQLADAQDELLKGKDRQLRSELNEKDRAVAGQLKDKDIKIGEAHKLAGIANSEAALANERAAHANEEAARLSRDAEELRRKNLETEDALEGEKIARLELEAAMAPRGLVIYSDTVVARLRRFANTTYAIEVINDREAIRLAEQLNAALQSADWVSLGITTTDDPAKDMGSGVTILARVGLDDSAIIDARNEVNSYLRAQNITTSLMTLDVPPGRILFRIGEKPAPNSLAFANAGLSDKQKVMLKEHADRKKRELDALQREWHLGPYWERKP